jgi:RNA polymerase sigma-70 factor (sigma-E family)
MPTPASAVAALEALHEGHYATLLRIAVVLVDSEAAAEDVVQEAYVKVLRRWGSIRDERLAAAYLRQAVVNGARDQLRRRRVRRLLHIPDEVPPAGPEAIVLLQEEHREVFSALNQLPARQREVLVLRHYMSLSEAETADALGITVAAAKSAAHKGIAKLRRQLTSGEHR